MVPPESIDCERRFWKAFGHHETECAANTIVRYMRHHGNGWQPFTYAQIDEFYQAHCRVTPFPPPKLAPEVVHERLVKAFEDVCSLENLNTVPKGHTEHFYFYDLDHPSMLVKRGDLYEVTPAFVERCHKASPVR